MGSDFLKKYGIGILGILTILIFVVMASGCTSNGSTNSTPQFKKDIVIGGASYTYFAQDGSSSGGCWLKNKGSVEYTKVKINLEIFDKDGNSIDNQTIVIGKLSPGEEINYARPTGEDPLPNGASAKATVVNATASQ